MGPDWDQLRATISALRSVRLASPTVILEVCPLRCAGHETSNAQCVNDLIIGLRDAWFFGDGIKVEAGVHHMWADIVTAVVAIIVLACVVGVRSLTKGRIKITLPDAIIATIAAVLTLFLAGGADKVNFSLTGVSVEKAILSASQKQINAQVTELVTPVEEAEKGGTAQIPQLVQRQVQALEFLLGSDIYTKEAIQEYLQTLSKYPFFRFVVFLNPDRTFFGMVDAKRLLVVLENSENGLSFASFATLVKGGSFDGRARLASLPGFVSVFDAVTSDSHKRDVLQKMQGKNTEWLPVLNSNRKLQGIVDRSRLIVSLILDVTNQLEGGGPSQ